MATSDGGFLLSEKKPRVVLAALPQGIDSAELLILLTEKLDGLRLDTTLAPPTPAQPP